MRRVVITGIGAISPIGHTASENWDSLIKGRSGIRPISLFDASAFASRIAGEVPRYKPKDHFQTKDLKKIDRFIQFALIAAEEAFKSSGLDLEKIDRERFGSCVGVGIGGMGEIQFVAKEVLEKGPKRISPFFIPMVIANMAAGHISIRYGLKGPNTCITTACSSSAHAIGESLRLIRYGIVDFMAAGGAEAAICETGVGGFCAARALSVRNSEPEKASRPFDKDRDGFVIGEGAAVLILEEYENAKRRGATLYAEVVGYALNSDAYHITQPAPNGEGGTRCMKLALKDAGLNPSDVDYINAHGTSTPLGDIQETVAVKNVFGAHAYKLAVSSTKSMTGHLLGAAGAIEAMYCAQAIQHQVAPPTINLDQPSPECDLNYVPKEPQTRKLNIALTNSFGFGGTNASLILKKV